MSRIDPTRLTEIFRTLSSPASAQSHKTKKQESDKDATKAKPAGVRDLAVLKARMQQRLKKLKAESKNFENEATIVAVQEILLWEFGPDILNHSSFKHITLKICGAIGSSTHLNEKLEQMLKQLKI